MTEQDDIYLNVPALLGRKALKMSESAGLIEDPDWNMRFSESILAMARFFNENGLLRETLGAGSDFKTLVLRLSDFTDEGRRFIKTGAPDKWLASFDRNPSKARSDVSLLIRRLKSLRK